MYLLSRIFYAIFVWYWCNWSCVFFFLRILCAGQTLVNETSPPDCVFVFVYCFVLVLLFFFFFFLVFLFCFVSRVRYEGVKAKIGFCFVFCFVLLCCMICIVRCIACVWYFTRECTAVSTAAVLSIAQYYFVQQ